MTATPLVCGLVVGVLLARPTAWADPPPEEEDAPVAPVVHAIDFEGNALLDDGELEEIMLTREKSWLPWEEKPRLDEADLRADLERIADLYREHGHYEAAAEYALEPEDGGDAVRVRIQVTEGPPIVLRAFRVTWADPPGASLEGDELLEGLPLVVGERFGNRRYREARDELLSRMADRARPDARLEGGAEIELTERAARVAWVLHRGPSVRMGRVHVEGLEQVEEKIVRREVTIAPGDPFDLAALEKTRLRVSDLGLFRSVRVEPRRPTRDLAELPPPDTVETWDVDVRVQERKPRTLRASIGYGTEDLFRAKLSWRHRNFLGGARSLELTGKYSSLVLGGEVRFVQPYLFDSDFDLSLRTTFGREDEPAYDAIRLVNVLVLQRPLVERFVGRVGYGIELGDVTDFKTDDPRLIDPEDSTRLAHLRFGLLRDGRDDPLETRRGTWLDLSFRPYLRQLGGDEAFLRLDGEARAYYPLWRTVVALRAHVATIEPIDGTDADEVPVYSRFYSGGSTTVRGYRYHRLPPIDDDDRPLGGLSLAETSVELRFPIWWRIGGVAFFDAGQLHEQPFTWRIGDFRTATGGGLRISTPVGPIRFDAGYALNPPPGVGPFRVYFSVGHMF